MSDNATGLGLILATTLSLITPSCIQSVADRKNYESKNPSYIVEENQRGIDTVKNFSRYGGIGLGALLIIRGAYKKE